MERNINIENSSKSKSGYKVQDFVQIMIECSDINMMKDIYKQLDAQLPTMIDDKCQGQLFYGNNLEHKLLEEGEPDRCKEIFFIKIGITDKLDISKLYDLKITLPDHIEYDDKHEPLIISFMSDFNINDKGICCAIKDNFEKIFGDTNEYDLDNIYTSSSKHDDMFEAHLVISKDANWPDVPKEITFFNKDMIEYYKSLIEHHTDMLGLDLHSTLVHEEIRDLDRISTFMNGLCILQAYTNEDGICQLSDKYIKMNSEYIKSMLKEELTKGRIAENLKFIRVYEEVGTIDRESLIEQLKDYEIPEDHLKFRNFGDEDPIDKYGNSIFADDDQESES